MVEDSRTYSVLSANFRDKAYPESFLFFNDDRNEMELREWTGKKKKDQTIIARFRVEPSASVLVDGPVLRVSELSITFDTPAAAQEVAELLRQPAKQREYLILLSEGEAAVKDVLKTKEEAVAFLAMMRTDPRRALVGSSSLWPEDDVREPFEAIQAAYSARVSDSLEKMKSSLATTEHHLGAAIAKKLYAVAYTIGAVQEANFRGDPDLTQEITALSALGIVVTVEELRAGISAEKLLQRAHPALVSLTVPAKS